MLSRLLAPTAAACLFLAGNGSAAPGEGKVGRSVEKVLAALEREGEVGLEQAARKLAELGDPAIPLLIQQLTGKGLAERASASALQELGREAVVAHVSAAVAEDLSLEQRVALLHLLGLVGTERDLSLTVRAAGEAGAIFASEGLTLAALERSLELILGRAPHAVRQFPVLLRSANEAVAPLLVELMSARPSADSFQALASVLGTYSDLDLLMLPHLGRIGAAVPTAVDEYTCARVRRLLDSSDHQIVRAAAAAAAELQDLGALEELIGLLRSDDPILRAQALRSLHVLTELRYPADASRWELWLSAERRWYAERAPHLFVELDHYHPRVVLAALEELSQHRFERHALAREIERVLSHQATEVRRRACEVLGRMDPRSAVGPLTLALSDDDDTVASTARSALEAITGAQRPAESASPAALPR